LQVPPSKAPDLAVLRRRRAPSRSKLSIPRKTQANIGFLQPSPIEDGGKNYYDYDAEIDQQEAIFSRATMSGSLGGSTWHWQGIYIRMLPNDFKMKSLYKVGF